jgi:cell division protease FtsH
VLALAHALESHKTLSGEDVTAVFDGGRGPLVNGAPYMDDAFIAKLRDYHLAAKRAHQQHNKPELTLPVAEPAYAIADYGAGSFFDGSFNGNGNGAGGATGTDDVIDFGGLGSGNGSHGPYGAPTYDPPSDGPDNEQP